MSITIKFDRSARDKLDPLAIGAWELDGLRYSVINADKSRSIINTDKVAEVLLSGMNEFFLLMLGPGLRMVKYSPETGVGTFEEANP